jgi:magnesium-transporting ATPase (P-type)
MTSRPFSLDIPFPQTGDAVALLGSLRPDTALLLEPGSFAVTAPALVPTAASPPSPALTSISSIETKHSSSAINTKTFASGNVGDVTTLLVPVEVLELGDEILVQAGSLPPTDGTIVKGATTLDESSLTGESKPIKKTVGDEVLTGTVNLGAAIVMRVDKLGEETMIESVGCPSALYPLFCRLTSASRRLFEPSARRKHRRVRLSSWPNESRAALFRSSWVLPCCSVDERTEAE